MPIRLIAIDIDGTLLDSHWQLPAANRTAIVEAVERGIEVALVTGRRFDFALPIARDIPCALTMIVNNGALIKSKDGATHLRNLLPKDVARRVLLDTLPWRAGAAVVFDRPRENQVIWEFMDWDDPGRRSYFERNREYLAQMAPLESCLNEDPIQVMFTGPVAAMRALADALPRLPYAAEFAMAVTEYEDRDFSLVDVIKPGCSKGATLAAWVAQRGLAREHVMAIGDNLNDREMLEFAGLPVVMANSVPALKSNGWHVTLSNEDAGVAAAIQQFVLGDNHVDVYGARTLERLHSPAEPLRGEAGAMKTTERKCPHCGSEKIRYVGVSRSQVMSVGEGGILPKTTIHGCKCLACKKEFEFIGDPPPPQA